MPQYDYNCQNPHCAKSYTYLHLGSDDKVPQCPHCGSNDAEKQISKGTDFALKGGGWHNDMYNKNGRKGR